jgi:hypothetical protein
LPKPASMPRSSNEITNLATAVIAPQNTPLWKTTYANFAPRVGIAFHLCGLDFLGPARHRSCTLSRHRPDHVLEPQAASGMAPDGKVRFNQLNSRERNGRKCFDSPHPFGISPVGKDCRVVRGLLPFGLAHMEKLFSDGVLWHVAELIEHCQNGRTTNVTFL